MSKQCVWRWLVFRSSLYSWIKRWKIWKRLIAVAIVAFCIKQTTETNGKIYLVGNVFFVVVVLLLPLASSVAFNFVCLTGTNNIYLYIIMLHKTRHTRAGKQDTGGQQVHRDQQEKLISKLSKNTKNRKTDWKKKIINGNTRTHNTTIITTHTQSYITSQHNTTNTTLQLVFFWTYSFKLHAVHEPMFTYHSTSNRFGFCTCHIRNTPIPD